MAWRVAMAAWQLPAAVLQWGAAGSVKAGGSLATASSGGGGCVSYAAAARRQCQQHPPPAVTTGHIPLTPQPAAAAPGSTHCRCRLAPLPRLATVPSSTDRQRRPAHPCTPLSTNRWLLLPAPAPIYYEDGDPHSTPKTPKPQEMQSPKVIDYTIKRDIRYVL